VFTCALEVIIMDIIVWKNAVFNYIPRRPAVKSGLLRLSGMCSVFGYGRRGFHCFEYLLRGFGREMLVNDWQVDFLLLGRVDFDESV
jgi:hypothetical protein